jgi:hypothetical protein
MLMLSISVAFLAAEKINVAVTFLHSQAGRKALSAVGEYI